jgi:hypothetical protein
MIRTGSEQPSNEELGKIGGAVAQLASGEIAKVYYERKGEKNDLTIVSGLREFHRRHIKERLLLGSGLRGGGKTLVDLACGQGGDLWSWVEYNAAFVFGTDIAGNGIRDPVNGAYRRYLNAVMKNKGYENVGRMIFTIGSSSKNLATGEAGATSEEANMMRAIMGRVAPEGPVPPFVKNYGSGRLQEGADCVAIMFAIHYFFENQVSLSGFMRNVSDCLKIGGLFVGCCFDGQKVFDGLRNIEEGGTLKGSDGADNEIWRITKRYTANDLTNGVDSLGLPIDVKFLSIGTEQREYLVSFDLLKAEMAKIGCELLTKEECKDLGITNSTQMFEDTYAEAGKKGNKFPMIPVVRQYSFFNRWFIFKRRRGGVLEEDDVAAVVPQGAEAVAPQGAMATAAVAPQGATAATQGAQEAKAVTFNEKAAVATNNAVKAATAKAAAPAPAAAVAKAAAPTEVQPTIPTAKDSGDRRFDLTQLFQFYVDASKVDKLKIGDADAARWLAPSAQFPIKAEEEVEYPSVEHYLAAMKYQLASNKPDLGREIFARDGTIHQDFQRRRATESAQGTRALSAEREADLLKEERAKVIEESAHSAFKKYRAVFNDKAWFAAKDAALEKALKYRWENDARLRRIVEAARAKGLYLLYYTGPGSGSDLGGKRTAMGLIDGENKVGKILMKLANFRV